MDLPKEPSDKCEPVSCPYQKVPLHQLFRPSLQSAHVLLFNSFEFLKGFQSLDLLFAFLSACLPTRACFFNPMAVVDQTSCKLMQWNSPKSLAYNVLRREKEVTGPAHKHGKRVMWTMVGNI
ncbi:unnamed protein product [Pleuronectes platessa]|uniref:Uncharacterized protein n=1 Tax=Pleuronectes platessa TaxID=8262 RepID=A0A9N7YBM8_PLEPL|nr:unnamed protein product [Pleuronectes platessa]